MACYHPFSVARKDGGGVAFSPSPSERLGRGVADWLDVPCGTCVGCVTSRARAWAIRCSLELQRHSRFCWATLTYDDDHLPPTLSKRHVQLFFKRLRHEVGPVRFFACGEYGETTYRPHYHAILFGTANEDAVRKGWGMGHVRVDRLQAEAISYVTGYTLKKREWSDRESSERLDTRTGELYEFQPPFQLMSRRPGIGGDARAFRRSWRTSAIWDGREVPVPRFLHEAWKAGASDQELLELACEKRRKARPVDYDRLRAAEQIARAKQSISLARRTI